MQLTPEESSKLGLVAQFSTVERARGDLEEIVKSLNGSAKKVGQLLLGEIHSAKPEELETAEVYRGWRRANIRIGRDARRV